MPRLTGTSIALVVPTHVLAATTSEALADTRKRAENWRTNETELRDRDLSATTLADLAQAAKDQEDAAFGRTVAALQRAQNGDFSKPIPKIAAARATLISYLSHELVDGWLYQQTNHGSVHAYLVRDVSYDPGDQRAKRRPSVSIHLVANGNANSGGLGVNRLTINMSGEDVTRKTAARALAAQGFYKETPELREAYDAALERYRAILTGGFAEQYRYTGTPFATDAYGRRTGSRNNTRVVHDIPLGEIPPFSEASESILFDDIDDDVDGTGVGSVPVIPVLRVFDLAAQEDLWIDTEDLTAYEYDLSLRDKLVLPESQRELLDILTTDIATFTGDIIDGKSAGNVILCKGIPGVGKTLTAEVYAELIERPLLSVHSGTLGITAEAVRGNLEAVFKRAHRLNLVTLIDEADVFVLERGENIQQNAIVAEFLRTLEYTDSLLFMTTNRANEIDDAILSRCAAIIDYQLPGREDARKVWKVMAANAEVQLDDALIDDLLTNLETATPRDIKMLLRLALRVASHRGVDPSLDVFRQCAMFRGVQFGIHS